MISIRNLQIPTLDEPIYVENGYSDYKWTYDKIAKIFERGQEGYVEKISSRLFLSQGTRDDLSELVFAEKKPENCEVSSWIESRCASDKFCLAINGINGLDVDLNDHIISEFNQFWLNQVGLPMGGIDTYCFAGRYSMTPFGIHTDREHTFLYHLGPNEKDCWLWEPAEFERANGSASLQFNMEKVEHLAKKIKLKPGDIVFIPAGHYHVLANPEFSMTMGIAPYERSLRDVFLDGLAGALDESTYLTSDQLGAYHTPTPEEKFAFPIAKSDINTDVLIESVQDSVASETERLLSMNGMKFPHRRRFVQLGPKSRIKRRGSDIRLSGSKDQQSASLYTGGSVLDLNASALKVVNSLLEQLQPDLELALLDLMVGDEEEDNIRLNAIHKLAELTTLEVSDGPK